ncbi:MAG: hypothetical protein PHE52_00210 [Candidatus Pacebacteria bacterium]|nr:hypothetical protein [Candidatus Paceibacterota bacterium]
MTKNLLKFLTVSILGSSVIFPAFVLAAAPPTGLTPCSGTQPLAVLLDWSDEAVHHYELYYKRVEDANWQDRYPSVSQYQVTGLSPSEDYQWYVVSCGNPECSDRAPSGICSFTTEDLAPPPDGDGGDGSPIDLTNPLAADNLIDALDAFLNFLFFLAMAVAPIMIIYAAYLILTSGGDPAKVSRGRQIILWTLIAVAIVLLAKAFPAIIKGAFGG